MISRENGFYIIQRVDDHFLPLVPKFDVYLAIKCPSTVNFLFFYERTGLTFEVCSCVGHDFVSFLLAKRSRCTPLHINH